MADNVKVSKLAAFGKNFVRFFKDVRAELKKVIWPTKEQLVNYTVTVLLTCFVIGLVIWLTDVGLTQVANWAFR